MDTMLLGLQVALSVEGVFYCFIGVLLGTFIGVLPGLGTLSAVAMLLPITFHLDPTMAIIMIAGIYYGAAYGGSTASILLNLPGTPQSVVTCLDGYPLAKKGRAGMALFITAIASLVGSIIGAVALVAASFPLAALARNFGAHEYFALMVVGLFAAAAVSDKGIFRALAMICVGITMGLIGIDINSGVPRFTFNQVTLFEGLSLVALALGLFGIPELVRTASGDRESNNAIAPRVGFGDMFPSRQEWRNSAFPMLRGSLIGSFFGALPGTGGTLGSFMSYSVERGLSSDPAKFGTGAIEGVAGPESANNAAVQTAFVPTLTLGIPGDAVMALILGVMLIHGVQPGPDLVTGESPMFWAIVCSFVVGNVMLLVINIPFINLWIRLLSVPRTLLIPVVVALVCIGVYSINYNVHDVFFLCVISAVGVVLIALAFPLAPLLLGFILGPMMEENFRRAMLVSRGDFTSFLTRPASLVIFLVLVAVVGWIMVKSMQKRAALGRPKPSERGD